ncbi:MAG: signal peptidase [Candidatus Saccharibacteria bacterium]|nr:signal peptidase [Candidatus Saccharibacteria bacterium]
MAAEMSYSLTRMDSNTNNLASPPSSDTEPGSLPSRADIDPDTPHVSPPSKRETVREIISTIGVLIAALLVAFGLIAWVFQSYEVDGPSMEATLHNKDRLIVWKVPRTIARVTGNPYIPNRGDIVIFVESGLSNFGSSDTKQLIKRVVGLPGERVVVRSGVITVYNDQHPEGFNPDKTMPHAKNIIEETSDLRDSDATLGDDQLFVCGDNRGNSYDSRTFGPIEANQVVGKLSLRLLPIGQIEKF